MADLNLTNLAQAMAETLRDDTALASWVQGQYDADLKIFIGLDSRNPPSVKDAPFVVVRAPRMDGGLEADADNYALLIDWGINEPGQETVAGITRYTGHAQADAMGRLILDAAYSMTEEIIPVIEEYEIESELFFPLIAGGATLIFSEMNTIAGEQTF